MAGCYCASGECASGVSPRADLDVDVVVDLDFDFDQPGDQDEV